MKIPNNILAYVELTRFHKPIGSYLLWLSCLFGLSLASPPRDIFIFYTILFAIGSILMRSAGCIINDIFDRDFDSKVERTKYRPLASGRLSVKKAIVTLIVILSLSLLILIKLNLLAATIALSYSILVVIYPLMKRITYWPQIMLGITFNSGILVSYATIKDQLDMPVIILYIGCIFWTMAYDTIYAFMDMKDDLMIGIKSSAIAIDGVHHKLIISSFYMIFISAVMMCLYIDNMLSLYSLLLLGVAVSLIIWIMATLRVKEANNCLTRFNYNLYIGLIIFASISVNLLNFT